MDDIDYRFDLENNQSFILFIKSTPIYSTSALKFKQKNIIFIDIYNIKNILCIKEQEDYKNIIIGNFEFKEKVNAFVLFCEKKIILIDQLNIKQEKLLFEKMLNYATFLDEKCKNKFQDCIKEDSNIFEMQISQNLINIKIAYIFLKKCLFKTQTCQIETNVELQTFEFDDFITISNFKSSFVKLCLHKQTLLLYVLKTYKDISL